MREHETDHSPEDRDPYERLFPRLEASGHDGECPYPCPICAGVGILRQLNPEIGEHLATAAKEFMLAAKAFLDSVAEGGSKKGSEPVERIPFD